MGLFDSVETAHDKTSFLSFLSNLIEDCKINKDTWQNLELDDFLEAMYSWIEDYHGDDMDFSNPSWKEFAAILYMGKIYE